MTVERHASMAAVFFFALGVLGAILSVIWTSETGMAIWAFGAVFFLLAGIIWSAVFRIAAEAIRLLKKQAGLPFQGRISGSGTERAE